MERALTVLTESMENIVNWIVVLNVKTYYATGMVHVFHVKMVNMDPVARITALVESTSVLSV